MSSPSAEIRLLTTADLAVLDVSTAGTQNPSNAVVYTWPLSESATGNEEP
jgi:hypothetical protein